jgi:hypothetical protein
MAPCLHSVSNALSKARGDNGTDIARLLFELPHVLCHLPANCHRRETSPKWVYGTLGHNKSNSCFYALDRAI